MAGPASVVIDDQGIYSEIVVGKGDVRPVVNATFAWPADGVLPTDLAGATGTVDVTPQILKADAPNPKTAGLASPDFPRALQVSTGGGFTTNTDVVVTVIGTLAGNAVSEVITLPGGGGGATVQGFVDFEAVTSVGWTTPAGWSAGFIRVQTGTTATVMLNIRSAAGTGTVVTSVRYAKVTTAATRKARYTWVAADVATAGQYDAWFEIQFALGVTLRAPGEKNLKMRVVA